VEPEFTVSGLLPGRYRVVMNLPGPRTLWRLSSATILGQEALDNAADVRQSVTDAIITVTDQLSTLTGKEIWVAIDTKKGAGRWGNRLKAHFLS
jgi:phage tail sheath protein FI